jgi:hypothetical protein
VLGASVTLKIFSGVVPPDPAKREGGKGMGWEKRGREGKEEEGGRKE